MVYLQLVTQVKDRAVRTVPYCSFIYEHSPLEEKKITKRDRAISSLLSIPRKQAGGKYSRRRPILGAKQDVCEGYFKGKVGRLRRRIRRHFSFKYFEYLFYRIVLEKGLYKASGVLASSLVSSIFILVNYNLLLSWSSFQSL